MGRRARPTHLEHDNRRLSRHATCRRNGGGRPARRRAARGISRRGARPEAWPVGRDFPAPPDLGEIDLVLHAAAWTDVDGAEADPQGAAAVNVGGTQNVARSVHRWCTSRPTTSSTGSSALRTSSPIRPIRSPPTAARSCTARRPRASRVDRAHLLALRLDGLELRPHDAQARRGARRGCGRRRPARLPDVRRRIWPTRRASSSSARPAIWHVAADGDCTWAEFAEAIFEEAGLDCRVRRITAEELGRPAPRPAYSVLRSAHSDAPRLPHWRDGLHACLARLR